MGKLRKGLSLDGSFVRGSKAQWEQAKMEQIEKETSQEGVGSGEHQFRGELFKRKPGSVGSSFRRES